MTKVKTPAPEEREGFECLLAGDKEAHTITAVRTQFLGRHGIPQSRVGLLGSLLFGEGRHG